MIRLDVRKVVGNDLTAMMNAELTHYLGREPYVRLVGNSNYRNGSHSRGFALKCVFEILVVKKKIARFIYYLMKVFFIFW